MMWLLFDMKWKSLISTLETNKLSTERPYFPPEFEKVSSGRNPPLFTGSPLRSCILHLGIHLGLDPEAVGRLSLGL